MESPVINLAGPIITAIGMIVGATYFIASLDTRISKTDDKIETISIEIKNFMAMQNTINETYIADERVNALKVEHIQERLADCNSKIHSKAA